MTLEKLRQTGPSASAVLVVVLFVQSGSALATEKLSKEQTAKKACVTGDFRKGIDILGDLFVTTNDPTHVYNQGRCYEQNRRLEEAIDRFREYLRLVPDASADDKADVNKHIADCKALITEEAKKGTDPGASAAATKGQPHAQEANSSAGEATSSGGNPAGIATAVSAKPLTPSTARPGTDLFVNTEPVPQAQSPIYRRWWFWGAIGAVVVAGAVTAIVLTSRKTSNVPSSALGNQGAF